MANRFFCTGRITAEPQLMETNNGIKVCRFTLAVSKKFDRKKADFIPCVAFNKQAEYVSGYAKKGMLVEVEGSLETYQKANTNPPQYGWNIQVTDFEILSTKKEMAEYNNKEEVENLPNKPRNNRPNLQPIEDTFPADLEIPF